MFPNLNWSSSFAIKIVLMLGFWILGMATEHLHVFIWEIDSFGLLQPWRCKREALNILKFVSVWFCSLQILRQISLLPKGLSLELIYFSLFSSLHFLSIYDCSDFFLFSQLFFVFTLWEISSTFSFCTFFLILKFFYCLN